MLDKISMNTKTGAFGWLLILLALVGDQIPWLSEMLTMPKDVLLITGISLICGRDAIQKLIRNGGGAKKE